MWPAHAAGSSASPSGRPVPAAVLCLLFALLLPACEATDNGIVPMGSGPAPAPAFVRLPDGIGLSLQAERLNRAVSGRVEFSSSAYRLSIRVANLRQGSLTLELRDQDGLMQRFDEITSDTTIADSGRTYGRPTFVTVVLSGFTGVVALALRDGGNIREIPAFEFPRVSGTTWMYKRLTAEARTETVLVEALRDTLYNPYDGTIAFGRWALRATNGSWVDTTYLYLFERGVVFMHDWDRFQPYAGEFPPSETMLNLRFPLRGWSSWRSGRFTSGLPNYWWSPVRPVETWFIESASAIWIDSMTVCGAQYRHVLRVDQQQIGEDITEPLCVHSTWIVPNVGIVRMEKYSGTSPNETWELIP